ncbi:MAG: hypothetical protein GF392_02665, partial [Candidatus Omnitrophica bacterium]|nr:hypothetical protein [Candidatus Omnitrophota bacterium]
MAIRDNIALVDEIEERLVSSLPVRLGVNKLNELVRLIYEIALREDLSCAEVFEIAEVSSIATEGRSGAFRKLKDRLLGIRYPSMQAGYDPHIMPLKISGGIEECAPWENTLEPSDIFVENDIKNTDWTAAFIERFPAANISYIDRITDARAALGRTGSRTNYNA